MDQLHDADGDDDVQEIYIPPLMGGLLGETLAEMDMHATARVTLLNLLMDDETVVAMFNRWIATTSI